MIEDKVIGILRRVLGLNSYEAKIYTALLSQGTSTPGELSELSGVPRSRTYDILESLERKGLVLMQVAEKGKPMRYNAIAPEQALDRLKRNWEDSFETRKKRLEEFKTSGEFKNLISLYKKGVKVIEPTKLTSTLRGRQSIYQHLELMLKGAKARVLMLLTENGVQDLYANQLNLIKEAYERGVKIKIAASISPRIAEAVKELSKYASIRHIPSDIEVVKEKLVADGASMDELTYLEMIKGRLCIADGKGVLIAITDEEKVHHSQDLCFWTESKHLASTILEPMFAMFWQHLEPASSALGG